MLQRNLTISHLFLFLLLTCTYVEMLTIFNNHQASLQTPFVFQLMQWTRGFFDVDRKTRGLFQILVTSFLLSLSVIWRVEGKMVIYSYMFPVSSLGR